MSLRQPNNLLEQDAPPVRQRPPGRWYSLEDILLIILVAAGTYLPGLGRICLFDLDEPRFAECAREMLVTGNYLVPHFNGALRPDKPPLVYWLMTIFYHLMGVSALAARLPSAVCGTLTLLVIYWMTGSRFGRITGVLAALMMSVVVVFAAESRLATADSTMLFFTTLAMACAWRAWDGARTNTDPAAVAILPKAHHFSTVAQENNGSLLNELPAAVPPMPFWLAMVFWVAIVGGILAKGVTLLFVFAALIPLSVFTGAFTDLWRAWRKLPLSQKFLHLPGFVVRCFAEGNWSWWKRLRPAIGIPVMVVLTLPWFVAAWIATNGALIERMIGYHVFDRAIEGLQHHGEPPGYYLVMVWITFFPWSVLLVPAGYHTVRRLMGRTAIAIDRRPYQFLVAYIVPAWIIYELIVTKLVHYVLPLYVPLVILCADTLVQSWHRMTDVFAARWFAVARWVYTGLWIAGAVIVLWISWHYFPSSHRYVFYDALPFAALLAATGIVSAISWNRPAWPFLIVLSFSLSLMLGNTLWLPHIKRLRLSQRASHEMLTMWRNGYQLAAAGYVVPTMVFYTRQRVRLFHHVSRLVQTVPFRKNPPGLRPKTRAALPPPAASHSASRTAPSAGNHPAEPRVAAPRWCVAVNPRALRALRAKHLRYYFLDAFRGLDEENGRMLTLTLITNVNWHPKPVRKAPPPPPGHRGL